MKLRYVELDIDRIFNVLAPENKNAWGALEKYRDTWWDEQTVEVRKYFAECWREVFDEITNHFTELRKSIKEKGILRPVSTVSGPMRNVKNMKKTADVSPILPPKYQQDVSQNIYTQPCGGSRITIAHELGIDKIPCVVHDYSDLFPDAEDVTKGNYSDWFGNDYRFVSSPPHIRIKTQLHLRGVHASFGNESKKARHTANVKALERTMKKYG